MSTTNDHATGRGDPNLGNSLEPSYSVGLKQTFESNAEELLWIAEIMTGSREAADECLAAAFELAGVAQHVGREWILAWLKRLVTQVALKMTSSEICEVLPSVANRVDAKPLGIDLTSFERQKLRSISARKIIASCNVLERACFILSVYLRYPLLDCALLLGCPRGWIEPVCERAFAKVIETGLPAHDELQRVDLFGSLGVTRCLAN